MKQGYANKKREELFEKLKTVFGKITNISTGIEANLSKKSLDKMTSAKELCPNDVEYKTLGEV